VPGEWHDVGLFWFTEIEDTRGANPLAGSPGHPAFLRKIARTLAGLFTGFSWTFSGALIAHASELLAIICPAFVVSGKLHASGGFKSGRLFDDPSDQDELFAGLLRCGTQSA
jgi:hypothetical protein